jgi:predicted PurR-regulated permease PerM
MESGRRPHWRRSADAVGSRAASPGQARPAIRTVGAWATTGLFVLACLYTLAVARDFLLPLAIAVMTYFLLLPLVRGLKGARIPEPVGAAVVLLGLVAVLAAGLYALSWPASEWMARAPQSVRRVEARLKPLTGRLQRLGRTAAEVEKITEVAGPPAPEVQLKQPSLGAAVFGGMQSLLGNALVVLTLVYFLLAAGDRFLDKVAGAFRRVDDRQRAVEIAREMEKQISRYLVLTTLINVVFGAVVGLVLWALGMPNPLLWGAVAGVTNFIPYVGSLVCLAVLSLAAVVAYDSLWWAMMVALVFFVINTLEGYVITPMIMGRRFTLDPAVLVVGLLFWSYVWGIAGALLAVPMMAAFKIVCARVEPLQGLALFLGEESEISAPPAAASSEVRPGPPA